MAPIPSFAYTRRPSLSSTPFRALYTGAKLRAITKWIPDILPEGISDINFADEFLVDSDMEMDSNIKFG